MPYRVLSRFPKTRPKNVGSRTKTWNVCIMVFRRNVHIKWDFCFFFKDCLVFSCIFTQPRQIWVWWSVKSVAHVNNFSSLYQCFCLCALACAYLPTFLIGLLSAAFLALKEPPLIINIRYQMAFKLFQTNSDTHSRMGETFEDYHIVKPGIWIYFLFNALKFWRYKFCLTML